MSARMSQVSLALSLSSYAGCAIGVKNDDIDLSDSSARVSDPDDEDAVQDEEQDDDPAQPDAGSAFDAGSDSGASANDAGTQKDAGVARDAAVMDGGPADAGLDTGTANDAGMGLDAGTPRQDASAGVVDAGTDAGHDAGRDGGAGPSCTPNTCTNDCSLIGPLRCCRDNGSCGCSWAPGAYCM